MQVCGYAGLRYAVRRWKGFEHVFVVFTVMHLAEVLLFSHPMPVDRVSVLWFLSHPVPLRIWVVCALLRFWFHGSRRIMEAF